MNRPSRRVLSTAPFLAAVLLTAGARPASAQNTYADAPFNQGSLFYRPSGRNAPSTAAPTIRQVVPTTPTTPAATAPRQVRAYRPVAPTAPRVQARRRFGLFRGSR